MYLKVRRQWSYDLGESWLGILNQSIFYVIGVKLKMIGENLMDLVKTEHDLKFQLIWQFEIDIIGN